MTLSGLKFGLKVSLINVATPLAALNYLSLSTAHYGLPMWLPETLYLAAILLVASRMVSILDP